MRSTFIALVAAALLAIGVALGGWFVGQGFITARAGDRFVTVKGVAERLVAADLALWPIRFVTTSNELAEAQERIAGDAQRVLSFLAAQGLPQESVEVENLQVTDLLAQAYRSGTIESRFIVTQTLMVRTSEVDTVALASQKIGDLVAAGVVLSSEGQPSWGPIYLFTRLNDIKPSMIAEATKSAREGAEQFAKDSASRISGIRRASQGLFQILPRDDIPGMSQEKQIAKTVRVVSTIDYALAD
ncbi:MAG: SIMPL domain-containing protein [Methyloceanibacter sp.]